MITRLPQLGDTPLTSARNDGYAWRYLSARNAESRDLGQPGQDYLVLVHRPATFVFALCDGVGQSFFGNLASRFLGDALVHWLWRRTSDIDTDVSEQLTNYLRQLVAPATRLVESYPLPACTPRIIAEVLDEKRAAGSETTFVCGRIDLPTLARPSGNLLLAWMGDSRVRVWGATPSNTVELLGSASFRTCQRWSTRSGPVRGHPDLFLSAIRQDDAALSITRVLAYSDGARWLDALSDTPVDAELTDQVEYAHTLPSSDDITLLELMLLRDRP